MDDIYYHAPRQRYLRLDGNYYTWTTGKGWTLSSEEKMSDLALFFALVSAQKEVFVRGLKEQGLIG